MKIHKDRFGQNLKDELDSRGWSQTDLARYSGVCRSAINEFVNGHKMPTLDSYLAICKTLRIDYDRLLKGVVTN